MRNSFIKIMVTMLILLSTSIYAQVKNAKTATVKVYGNCGMCKSKIETAGSQKKLAVVTWDAETKMATITYNSEKTNLSEILQRIAAVGYDSDQFQAPNEVYEKLHGCCQYDRPKSSVKKESENPEK